MKYCQNCGNQMEDNELFCAQCGTRSEVVSPPPKVRFGGLSLDGGMKLPILIVNILVMVSCLLPYLKVSALGMSQSMSLLFASGSMGDGIIFILLSAAAIASVLFLERKPLIPVILAALNVLMCVVKIVQFQDLGRQLSIFSGIIGKGVGYYLIILTTVLALVFSVLTFLQRGRGK